MIQNRKSVGVVFVVVFFFFTFTLLPSVPPSLPQLSPYFSLPLNPPSPHSSISTLRNKRIEPKKKGKKRGPICEKSNKKGGQKKPRASLSLIFPALSSSFLSLSLSLSCPVSLHSRPQGPVLGLQLLHLLHLLVHPVLPHYLPDVLARRRDPKQHLLPLPRREDPSQKLTLPREGGRRRRARVQVDGAHRLPGKPQQEQPRLAREHQGPVGFREVLGKAPHGEDVAARGAHKGPAVDDSVRLSPSSSEDSSSSSRRLAASLGPEKGVLVVVAEGVGEAEEGADEEEGGADGVAAGGGLFFFVFF